MGFVAAAGVTRLLRSMSAEQAALRLLRTGWRELAGLATLKAHPERTGWVSRMLEHSGLSARVHLTPGMSLTPERAHMLWRGLRTSRNAR